VVSAAFGIEPVIAVCAKSGLGPPPQWCSPLLAPEFSLYLNQFVGRTALAVCQIMQRGRRQIDTKRFELPRMVSFLNQAIEKIMVLSLSS